MATTPPPPFHDLDPAPVPALLLGGVNLVRCLGLAGIPAVVASPDPTEPAFASRHCRAAVVIPPYDHPKAVNRILAIRERLRRHFAMLLNEPSIANALIDKERFQALAAARSLPVPRELRWDTQGSDA